MTIEMDTVVDIETVGYTPGRFYNAVRPIFLFARIFGVMPVKGLMSRDPSHLKFSWLSIRTIHTQIIIAGLVIFNILAFYRLLSSRTLSFSKARPLVFYGSNLYAMVCFLLIARKFPAVMKKWVEVESSLPRVKNKQHQYIMTRKIRLAGIVFLITSIIEHLLTMSQNIYFTRTCQKYPDWTEGYYRKAAPQLFIAFNFSMPLAFLTSFFLITSTFIWNYMDVFIMIISFGLYNTFQQINRILLDVQRKNMPLEFFLKIRTHYRNIIMLCDLVDDTICSVTLISFSNNFFYICVKFLEVFDKAPTLLHSLAFWFSLFYLIIKSYFVSVYCSKVHEESRVPLDVLRCVPRKSWHPELQRFLDEIKNSTIGLSGMKFFYITKGLILTVASTIFTYDLVLIHFHTFDENDNDPCD